MANRQLLAIHKLEDFTEWLASQGFEIQKPHEISCEVLRAKKDKRTVVIYKKHEAQKHLSVMDRDVGLVRRYIKEKKRRNKGDNT